MVGPPVINRKYLAGGSGRDTFIFWDASQRGGRQDVDKVMKFHPQPLQSVPTRMSTAPHKEWTPFPGAGRAALHRLLSAPSPRSISAAKDRMEDPRASLCASPRHPLLSPREDPALGVGGMHFERQTGLAACRAPPPPSPHNELGLSDLAAAAMASGGSASAHSHAGAARSMPPLQLPVGSSEDMVPPPSSSRQPKNGFARNDGGGFWC